MEIKKFPDPVLRKKASLVKTVRDGERALLKDMAETMYFNNGVGLAAVQVGIDKQLAVIDVGEGLIKLINPVVVKREGIVMEEEGCLSVPETIVKVKRAKRVIVSFLKEDGEVCQLAADGLLARAIQHEVDHLSGKLIIDYLSPFKRLFLSK